MVPVGVRLGATEADDAAMWQHLGPVRDTTHTALSPEVLALVANGVDGPGPQPVTADWIGRGTDAEMVEGARWRIEVAPGLVAIRSADPARRERALVRAEEDRQARVRLEVAALQNGQEIPEPKPDRSIRVWSRKSRANMTRQLSALDYRPFYEQEGRPAMATLTYPGDWLTVAPDAATCHGHLKALRRRFLRHYGRPLIGPWKREFQRRGAPHYHLGVIAPPTPHEPLPGHEGPSGEPFRHWLARSWADIVAHPDPDERRRHRIAGTAVDFAEGAKMTDPRRLAVYFSKHGAFAAKEYQNEPPAEWTGSVGRFWGVAGLKPLVEVREIAPDVARAVARTARRWADANTYRVPVMRWRKTTWETLDPTTGELVPHLRWRKRRTSVKVRRLSRSSGYLVVNDGPAFATQLAAWAALATAPDRSGVASFTGQAAARASGAARRPSPGRLRRGFLP